MENVLPKEICNKIKLYAVHNPIAEMIKDTRRIYSLDKISDDEYLVDRNLWSYRVLKFENQFGIIMVDD